MKAGVIGVEVRKRRKRRPRCLECCHAQGHRPTIARHDEWTCHCPCHRRRYS
jgi:hypothetical protein